MRTALPATPPLKPSNLPRLLGLAAAAVVVIGLVVAAMVTSRGPHFVKQITVVNPTAYNLDVEATDGGRSGWTGLGTVDREGTRTFQQVVDEGDHWILRFTYAGESAGELRLSRQQLQASRWRVDVPVVFGDHLATAGVTPPPH